MMVQLLAVRLHVYMRRVYLCRKNKIILYGLGY